MRANGRTGKSLARARTKQARWNEVCITIWGQAKWHHVMGSNGVPRGHFAVIVWGEPNWNQVADWSVCGREALDFFEDNKQQLYNENMECNAGIFLQWLHGKVMQYIKKMTQTCVPVFREECVGCCTEPWTWLPGKCANKGESYLQEMIHEVNVPMMQTHSLNVSQPIRHEFKDPTMTICILEFHLIDSFIFRDIITLTARTSRCVERHSRDTKLFGCR